MANAAAPAVEQTRAALAEASAKPGEAVGRVKLTVPPSARSLVIEPVLSMFRAQHPRIGVELAFEDRRVDIVREGYDAGIRLGEYLERDMVSVRLTDPFRFIVVGAPSYLERRGAPQRPEDLAQHECLTWRSPTNGALYAWELEQGERSWRVPVEGGVVVNDGTFCVALAVRGLGLAYAIESMVESELGSGELRHVLEPYTAAGPGFSLYYPSRAQRSPALRLFVETALEATAHLRGRTTSPR